MKAPIKITLLWLVIIGLLVGLYSFLKPKNDTTLQEKYQNLLSENDRIDKLRTAVTNELKGVIPETTTQNAITIFGQTF